MRRKAMKISSNKIKELMKEANITSHGLAIEADLQHMTMNYIIRDEKKWNAEKVVFKVKKALENRLKRKIELSELIEET